MTLDIDIEKLANERDGKYITIGYVRKRYPQYDKKQIRNKLNALVRTGLLQTWGLAKPHQKYYPTSELRKRICAPFEETNSQLLLAGLRQLEEAANDGPIYIHNLHLSSMIDPLYWTGYRRSAALRDGPSQLDPGVWGTWHFEKANQQIIFEISDKGKHITTQLSQNGNLRVMAGMTKNPLAIWDGQSAKRLQSELRRIFATVDRTFVPATSDLSSWRVNLVHINVDTPIQRKLLRLHLDLTLETCLHIFHVYIKERLVAEEPILRAEIQPKNLNLSLDELVSNLIPNGEIQQLSDSSLGGRALLADEIIRMAHELQDAGRDLKV